MLFMYGTAGTEKLSKGGAKVEADLKSQLIKRMTEQSLPL